MRGSGVRGLAGTYPVVDEVIIRPLIEFRHRELVAFLKARRVRYRIDETNRDTRLTRNRVRRRLIPLLEREYNPAVIEALAHAADILRDEEAFMEQAAASACDSIMQRDDRAVTLRVRPLRGLPAALQRRVLRIALTEVRGHLRRITRAHVEAALRLLEEPRRHRGVTLPDGLTVCVEENGLRISVKPRRDRPLSAASGPSAAGSGACRVALCPVPGEIALPDLDLRLKAQVVERDDGEVSTPRAGPNQAYLDADLLPGPLLIRPRRAGDRFVPLGAPGSRKVKSFLIDRKIPVDERGRIPLVLSGDRIAWIVGHQIDDRFKVTANTRRILLLEKESR